METPKTTPKDFFLWAGALVTLFGSVIAFIGLLFDYINYVFPDEIGVYYANPYQSGMSYEMASLIVLVPAFLVLMRLIRRDIARDASRGDIGVRRWGLYFTLFIAGATVITDLIMLLTTFLSGDELTVRFLLKSLVVFLVSGVGFLHFVADLRGYWSQYPTRARMVGYGTGILVAAAIVSGFFIIGTPQQARQYRLDVERVNDLQILQSEVTSFYQQKRVLPNTLSQLNDPLLSYTVPVDPETGEMYRYEKTADLGFRLCAVFGAESLKTAELARTAPVIVGGKEQSSSWYHSAGEVCFDRAIDPDFFPPLTK